MEHKKISAVIFDMDGVIVDSEFVYMDYLLEFARKKNLEVTMDQLNPMVGLSRKDSWTVMKNAVDNGQTWEELRDEFAVLDIYSQVDYKKIFRPEAYTTAIELKKRGYKVALASSTGPKLIARIMEETGMRPVFDLIVSGSQFKQSKPNPEIYHYTAKTLGIPEEECFVVEDSTVGIQAGKAAGMTVAALEDDRFGFDQSQADIHIWQISEILKFLPGTENIVLCGASSYEQKYYFNQDFKALPDHIKKELQIMCVLFTEDIGGVLTMEFTPEGELEFKVQADDKDYLFDEIGSGLKIRQYQREKKELLESLEGTYGGSSLLYYPVPDYRYPAAVYSDAYLPENGEVTNISARLDGPGLTFGSEEQAMAMACRNGVFSSFANSFLGAYRRGQS